MIEEEKQLLFKDLCGRLPYGVRGTVGACKDCIIYPHDITDLAKDLREVKPYLRPISSMTEEEVFIMWNIIESDAAAEGSSKVTDLLNEWHLDHHHLIEKGLALEAPKDMYKTE